MTGTFSEILPEWRPQGTNPEQGVLKNWYPANAHGGLQGLELPLPQLSTFTQDKDYCKVELDCLNLAEAGSRQVFAERASSAM